MSFRSTAPEKDRQLAISHGIAQHGASNLPQLGNRTGSSVESWRRRLVRLKGSNIYACHTSDELLTMKGRARNTRHSSASLSKQLPDDFPIQTHCSLAAKEEKRCRTRLCHTHCPCVSQRVRFDADCCFISSSV